MLKMSPKFTGNLNLLVRHYCASAELLHQAKNSGLNRAENKVKNVRAYMDIFGYDYDKAYRFAVKQPKIEEIDVENARRTVEVLNSFEISISDIEKMPIILSRPATSLRNRCEIFTEAKFKVITIPLVLKYLTINRSSITLLKTYSIIPENVNVPKELENVFQFKSGKKWKESQTLEELRMNVLSEYLVKFFEFTENDINNFWRSYKRTKHKSSTSILAMIDILKNTLEFTTEKIRKNSFLLHADPVNTTRILTEFTTIEGHNTKEMINTTPKLLMVTPEAIKQIIQHTKNYNVPSSAFTLAPDVLTLSPSTVAERLKDLKTIREFEGLFTNPRILKLVLHQIKAKSRLEYLQHLKFKNASLNVLCSASETFERYTREGADKTKGSDTTIFISHECQVDEAEVRAYFSRHPHWMCIPLPVIKENFDYLRSRGFKPPTIYQNVHILLYPLKKIIEKLDHVKQEKEYADITPSQMLSLSLYFLEVDYHFTGDGVWAESTDSYNSKAIDIPEPLAEIGLK